MKKTDAKPLISKVSNEECKVILRSALQFISILKWLLSKPVMNGTNVDHTRLILIRFFTHTLGSQLEKLWNAGVLTSNDMTSLAGQGIYGESRMWFGMDRLTLGHTMHIAEMLHFSSDTELYLVVRDLKIVEQIVTKLLPDEKLPVFTPQNLPSIVPPLIPVADCNAQNILDVLKFAQQILPMHIDSSSSASKAEISLVQHYLGWVCIEIIANNITWICKSKEFEQLDAVTQKKLSHLRKKIKVARNEIAHCASIDKLMKIDVLATLQRVLDNQDLFTDSLENAGFIDVQRLAAPGHVTSTTTAATTTATTTTTTTTSTTLTTAIKPDRAELSAKVPRKKVSDIRKIKSVPIGYDPKAWLLDVNSLIKHNGQLMKQIKKIQDIGTSLNNLKSLNDLSTDQIMIILLLCMQREKRALFDELITAFGRRVDWGKKVRLVVKQGEKETDSYIAVQVGDIVYNVEVFIHLIGNDFAGQDVEFGSLAITAVKDLSDIRRLIESGATPWQLFNCQFAKQMPIMSFLLGADTIRLIEVQESDRLQPFRKLFPYHFASELELVLDDVNHDLLADTMALESELAIHLVDLFDDYGFTKLINIEHLMPLVLTNYPSFMTLFADRFRPMLTQEMPVVYFDPDTLVRVEGISSMHMHCHNIYDIHKKYPHSMIQAIYNIYTELDIQAVQDYILSPGEHSKGYIDTLDLMLLHNKSNTIAKNTQHFSGDTKEEFDLAYKSGRDNPLFYMAIREIFRNLDDQKYENVRKFLCNLNITHLQIQEFGEKVAALAADTVAALRQPIALDGTLLAQFELSIKDNQISLLQLMRRMQIVSVKVLYRFEVFVAKVLEPQEYSVKEKEDADKLCSNIVNGKYEEFMQTLNGVKDKDIFAKPICILVPQTHFPSYIINVHSSSNTRFQYDTVTQINMGNLSIISMAGALIDKRFRTAIMERMTKLMQANTSAQAQERQ